MHLIGISRGMHRTVYWIAIAYSDQCGQVDICSRLTFGRVQLLERGLDHRKFHNLKTDMTFITKLLDMVIRYAQHSISQPHTCKSLQMERAVVAANHQKLRELSSDLILKPYGQLLPLPSVSLHMIPISCCNKSSTLCSLSASSLLSKDWCIVLWH